MGIAFLKMDRSRIKWRIKLAAAFDKSQSKAVAAEQADIDHENAMRKKEGRGGKWALFLLPFITVLREGLEAVVFVGGVSWGCGTRGIAADFARCRSTCRPLLFPSRSFVV
jgi:high-affinity iron transporter